MKKSEKKQAEMKKAENLESEIKKCFESAVRDAVKGMKSITAGLGKGKAVSDAKKCVYRSAIKVNKAFEKKDASGCCSVLEFKDEMVIGTDPDKPDSVSMCGTMYRARIQVGLDKWRDCISAFTMFMDELERLAKREAFVTSLEYDGKASWEVVFRVGACKPVSRPSKKQTKNFSKAKKSVKA